MPSCRSRSWAALPSSCAPTSTDPDDITGRPFMGEVIAALTRAPSAEETRAHAFDRSTPRFVESDSEENLHDLFVDNRWTDMLPIILPTEERVEAMLKGTSRSPDTVVGHMRPTSTREAWQYTVEKVAVNAVMAGARPEYLPVILALAATCASARASTTSSAASMAVVNGPVREGDRDELGHRRNGPVQSRQCHHRTRLSACSRRTCRAARCPK